MKIIIVKFFLLIFVFQSVYLSDSESDSASNSSEEEETKPKLNFEEIEIRTNEIGNEVGLFCLKL
jgi:hypothetical protein